MLVNSQPVQVNRRTAGFRLQYAGRTVPLTENGHPWTRLVTQDSRTTLGRKARRIVRFPAPSSTRSVRFRPSVPTDCAPFDVDREDGQGASTSPVWQCRPWR